MDYRRECHNKITLSMWHSPKTKRSFASRSENKSCFWFVPHKRGNQKS